MADYLKITHPLLLFPAGDNSSSAGEEDADIAALSPLFSPSDPNLESSLHDPSLPMAPLFLQVSCHTRVFGEGEGEEGEGEGEGGKGEVERVSMEPPHIPTCLSELAVFRGVPSIGRS